MSLAPIALFVYNRLHHTRSTVESLRSNVMANESELYIFSDGPKNRKAEKEVGEVRAYLHAIRGFKKVHILESGKNKGLALSIVEGINEIIRKYGKIIVMEDDLVSSPAFLSYMNSALDYYEDVPGVMHVSGYNFPIDIPLDFKARDTFLYRSPSCWGWGTWERAWKYYRKEPVELLKEFSKEDIYRFNIEGSEKFWKQVVKNYKGAIDSWAIFWYASVFKKAGLCIHPILSLINNIGIDGSGEHCTETMQFHNERLGTSTVYHFPKDLKEDEQIVYMIREFYRLKGPTWFSRIRGKLRKEVMKKLL